jgi:hypothetical protein
MNAVSRLRVGGSDKSYPVAKGRDQGGANGVERKESSLPSQTGEGWGNP